MRTRAVNEAAELSDDSRKNRERLWQRKFRPLTDLNLIDDFLFQAIAQTAEGEEFFRILLRTILNREIGEVRITAQKPYQGIDTDKHGIRIDAYIEEKYTAGTENTDREKDVVRIDEVESIIYDIEPTCYDLGESLPKRMRFYQGLMDVRTLEAGAGYEALPGTVIIFILPRDYFGGNRMVYTFRTMCEENTGIVCRDGTLKMVLYPGGTEGERSRELEELLHYFMESKQANAVRGDLERIHSIVEGVKRNAEVQRSYMKSWEIEQYIRKEEREEGIMEGREVGLMEGREAEREKSIRIMAETLREFGIAREQAQEKIREKFGLPAEKTMEYMRIYWN
ncbi:MAG: hypothetical protein Q4C60_00870 [Eubacteriales bacterium]|nr:hypothetical protein [Eubacteriales bacterium]